MSICYQQQKNISTLMIFCPYFTFSFVVINSTSFTFSTVNTSWSSTCDRIHSASKSHVAQVIGYENHQQNIRGAIKKFSAWPSSDQNKIKIVFASYSSKPQNTICTIWLLGYKYFVHFCSWRLSAVEVEKSGITQCNEMTILTDSFVPLHALLFWLRFEVVYPRFIPNNELWYKFLLDHVGIVREVFRNLCSVLVLAFRHPSDRQFVHTLKCTKYL